VGVDLEGGVGFAVTEAALDVNEVVVEGDQHAGVAVPQVVQGRVGRREVGGLDGAAERPADNSAFQAGLVATGEDEGVRVKRAPRSVTSVSSRRISSGGMSIARCDSSVLSGTRRP
jgi:hypothetical protein